MRRIASGLAALALAASAAACATLPPSRQAAGGGWIESWGTAVMAPSAASRFTPATPAFENVTIRQVVRLSGGGEQVRVRLSNEFGTAPLTIGAARIALVGGEGALVPGTERALTFAGAPGAVIPPGAPLVSDPVDLSVDDLAKLSISVYFPGATGPCSCHQVGLEPGFVSAPGDHTSGTFEPAQTIQMRAFLAGVEVLPRGPGRTVAAFGDSITDGVGSTAGANRRWPDLFAERLVARGDGVTWGVSNVGISGNRVLAPGAGDAALARFDRDVLGRPGVTHVIVFEGVNDLGIGFGASRQGPAPAAPTLAPADIIAGYSQLIARAHAHGIEVIGATIAPYEGASYWSEKGEAARQEINTWIRTSGAFDGVLDFDAAFRDPAHPSQMKEGLHAGDHLHGSDAGYRAVADSIDLSLFQ